MADICNKVVISGNIWSCMLEKKREKTRRLWEIPSRYICENREIMNCENIFNKYACENMKRENFSL